MTSMSWPSSIAQNPTSRTHIEQGRKRIKNQIVPTTKTKEKKPSGGGAGTQTQQRSQQAAGTSGSQSDNHSVSSEGSSGQEPVFLEDSGLRLEDFDIVTPLRITAPPGWRDGVAGSSMRNPVQGSSAFRSAGSGSGGFRR